MKKSVLLAAILAGWCFRFYLVVTSLPGIITKLEGSAAVRKQLLSFCRIVRVLDKMTID